MLRLAPADLLRATAPGAALRRGHVLAVDGAGLAAAIELAGPALAWVLGDDAVAPPLAGLVELIEAERELGVHLPPGAVAALAALAPRLRAGDVAVVIHGPRGAGRRAAAHRLARELGRPLLAIRSRG